MVDANWAKDNDVCAKNPRDCPDGITFSIWEKNTVDPITLAEHGRKEFDRKYIVSSGGEFNPNTGFAYPGFAIYRQVT